MTTSIIKVEGIGKRYVISHAATAPEGLRHLLERTLRNPIARLTRRRPSTSRATATEFWALKDISFEVGQGEAVAIIGRNGAGKSTLLRVLSRITEPTEGRVRLRGRVASLLEVGTGFHPELTGRENVYLNGAILGMTRLEIKRRFDEIVAFSGVEVFLDTPVKRYSSGMYVRLAFAVAAHLEPEILVVDEVLAVGDAAFQAKCLGKMKDVSHKEGRTVLFVSHNLQAVSTLTKRAVLLKDGRCPLVDDTPRVVARYLEEYVTDRQGYEAAPNGSTPSLIAAKVVTSAPSNTHEQGRPARFEFTIDNPRRGSLAFSFQVMDWLGRPVIHLGVYDDETITHPGRYSLSCNVPNLRLAFGRYTVTAHLGEKEGGAHYETVEGICRFEVVMYGRTRAGWSWEPGACAYFEDCSWSVEASRNLQ